MLTVLQSVPPVERVVGEAQRGLRRRPMRHGTPLLCNKEVGLQIDIAAPVAVLLLLDDLAVANHIYGVGGVNDSVAILEIAEVDAQPVGRAQRLIPCCRVGHAVGVRLDGLLHEGDRLEPFAEIRLSHLLEQSDPVFGSNRRRSRDEGEQCHHVGCQRASLISCSTISAAVRPAASAAKLMTIRWVSTVDATLRRSSSSAIGRPSSAARALAPSTRYCDARGPAPQETYSLMNGGASTSPGREVRTSVTAARTRAFDTGIRRTSRCNARTSSAVSTGATSAPASAVVVSTIACSSSFEG